MTQERSEAPTAKPLAERAAENALDLNLHLRGELSSPAMSQVDKCSGTELHKSGMGQGTA